MLLVKHDKNLNKIGRLVPEIYGQESVQIWMSHLKGFFKENIEKYER